MEEVNLAGKHHMILRISKEEYIHKLSEIQNKNRYSVKEEITSVTDGYIVKVTTVYQDSGNDKEQTESFTYFAPYEIQIRAVKDFEIYPGSPIWKFGKDKIYSAYLDPDNKQYDIYVSHCENVLAARITHQGELLIDTDFELVKD